MKSKPSARSVGISEGLRFYVSKHVTPPRRCAYLGFDSSGRPPPFSQSSPEPLRSPSWNESVEAHEEHQNPPYLCGQVMRRVRVLLTSVSASKVRSSRKLSLMRARLFFSTSGFRICKNSHHKCQKPEKDVGASTVSSSQTHLSVRFLKPEVELVSVHVEFGVA